MHLDRKQIGSLAGWVAALALCWLVVRLHFSGQSRSATIFLAILLGLAGIGSIFALAKKAIDADVVFLVAGMAIHLLVLASLLEAGGDLGFAAAIAAVAGFVGVRLAGVPLALLLALLVMAPWLAAGRLTEGRVVITVASLATALFGVGTIASALDRRRLRAEQELRRLKSLSDRLVEEEKATAAKLSEEGVEARRSLAVANLDQELAKLVSLVKRTLGANRVVLFDVDGEASELVPHCYESEGLFSEDCVIPIGRGPVGWVALRGRLYSSPSRDRPLDDPGYCGKGPPPRSLAAAPVKRGEQVVGVLVVDHLEGDAFASGDVELLNDFARWVAALLETAGAFRHQEEEAEKFRALHDASGRLTRSLELDQLLLEFLTLARETAGYDCAYVLYREGKGARILAGSGENAMKTGTRVRGREVTWASHLLTQDRGFILDVSGDRVAMPLVSSKEGAWRFHSILGVCFRQKDVTVGGLLLASAAKRYRARDQQILEILANQAAYAVDNARLYQRMEEMATTDGLTGLYNHRYFQEALEREIVRAERQKGRLGLLMLDIDHFKSFNDTYGHPVGDVVLRGLASVLRRTARKSDITARYGGEEFAVILLDADAKRAKETASRIVKAVRKHVFKAEGLDLKVTVSVGIGNYPADALVKADLIECADQALYYSKEHGRNQWTAYAEVKDRLLQEGEPPESR